MIVQSIFHSRALNYHTQLVLDERAVGMEPSAPNHTILNWYNYLQYATHISFTRWTYIATH